MASQGPSLNSRRSWDLFWGVLTNKNCPIYPSKVGSEIHWKSLNYSKLCTSFGASHMAHNWFLWSCSPRIAHRIYILSGSQYLSFFTSLWVKFKSSVQICHEWFWKNLRFRAFGVQAEKLLQENFLVLFTVQYKVNQETPG